jgi:hypothetical protein
VEETLLDLSAGTLSAEQQEKEEVLENPLITTTVSKSQAADLQFPIIKASNQVLPKERSP